MRLLAAALLVAALPAPAQDAGESRELVGQIGGRTALLNLYVTPRADGSARLNGEYLLLPTLQQRFWRAREASSSASLSSRKATRQSSTVVPAPRRCRALGAAAC